jgi:hypothetical protein
MRSFRSALLCAIAAGSLARAGTGHAQAPSGGTAADPQVLADIIQAEIAEIRGLPFMQPVRAENQTVEAASAFLDEELAKDIPPALAEHYGKVVRKLGLYRGPDTLDLRTLMKTIVSSQFAAYYDPREKAFYVLAQDLSELDRGIVFAHELYHGLQDQYFDLDAYTTDGLRGRSLNDDELLARASVVEGEATYIMTQWALQKTLNRLPERPVLAEVVRLQTEVDTAAMRETLEDPKVDALVGAEADAALAAIDAIPMFVMETLIGAYLKGMRFVFEVQGFGWSEVEKLYADAPPASTEQILHPEKWFARESPLELEWPPLEGNALLEGWDLLEQNVLGEIQWRLVFAEQGLEAEAEAAAAGWNGDRYAVLKRRTSDELLLLLYTSWDSEAEAAEFADSYGRVLEAKYAGGDEPTRMTRSGRDVLIVEGGDEASLDALIDFVKTAKRAPARAGAAR